MSEQHSEKQYSGIHLTSEGMQIDFSDEHFENACGPISLSLEPDSNVACERAGHSLKHISPRISTPAGMQIDVNAEHWKKMPFSIRVIFEPSSNETVDITGHPVKHKLARVSYSRETITCSARPKCRINVVRFNEMSESREEKQVVLPASTTISSKYECTKGEPSITRTEAGRKIDFRDRQEQNTRFSIVLNFESGSNVNEERSVISAKHPSQSTSTDAGIQSDCSHSQRANALSGMASRFEPDSNIIEDKEEQEAKH
jgi:hypothetical protein